MNDELEKSYKVAVFLGSKLSKEPVFNQAVVNFGVYLAEHQMTLVFGGSNTGTMKLLADTVLEHGGKVIGVFTGVLPKNLLREDLTQSIMTRNLAERKAKMLELADAIVALPGSIGTWDELFDALAQKKLPHGFCCPIGVLNINGFYDPLFALLENSFQAGFTSKKHLSLLTGGKTPEELFSRMSVISAAFAGLMFPEVTQNNYSKTAIWHLSAAQIYAEYFSAEEPKKSYHNGPGHSKLAPYREQILLWQKQGLSLKEIALRLAEQGCITTPQNIWKNLKRQQKFCRFCEQLLPERGDTGSCVFPD